MTVTSMPQSETETAPAKKKGKVKLIAIVAIIAIGTAAGWFLVLAPKDSAPAKPVAGAVTTLEPIQINLAAGHYLRLGLALQLTETAGAHGEFDGSKALDAAITIFTGLPLENIALAEQREAYKTQLLAELEHRYHGDVMEVFFTEFVTQ